MRVPSHHIESALYGFPLRTVWLSPLTRKHTTAKKIRIIPQAIAMSRLIFTLLSLDLALVTLGGLWRFWLIVGWVLVLFRGREREAFLKILHRTELLYIFFYGRVETPSLIPLYFIII